MECQWYGGVFPPHRGYVYKFVVWKSEQKNVRIHQRLEEARYRKLSLKTYHGD